jgi:hypothetical protein
MRGGFERAAFFKMSSTAALKFCIAVEICEEVEPSLISGVSMSDIPLSRRGGN